MTFSFLRTLRAPRMLLSVALATLLGGSAQAVDNIWDGEVSLDYNVDANWDNAAGDGGFVPSAEFDEVAVINNGDDVFLSSATLTAAGLAIANSSSLEIQSGGNLPLGTGFTDPVAFPGNASVSASSTLSVQPGGTLSVSSNLTNSGTLNVGGTAGGTANLTVTGTANLLGTTRVTGPSATFTAGSFQFGGGHTLTAAITNASTHSALSTTGTASLAGTLELNLNGVSPSVGDSWTIVDAGVIGGSFSATSAPQLPRGQAITVSTSAGGNGQQLTASISNQLILSIDAATGSATIENASGSLSEVINGYGIFSTADTITPGNWMSFENDGQSGWEESANTSSKHVSEVNLNSSRIVGPNAMIDLGAIYVPTPQFGVAHAPVSFEYSLASGETRQGAVELSPNTLVLQVDPATGQTQMVNPSGFDVALKAYAVISESGSLDAAAWTSFSNDGQSGWDESANATNKSVSETNLEGSRTLTMQEGDGPIALGNLFDHDAVGVEQDLVFEFVLAGDGGVSGDYNNDGVVNLADYTVWRDHLGAPAGTLPNDANGGVIGAGQYHTWKANYGATGSNGPGGVFTGLVQYVSLPGSLTAVTAVVPEPGSGVLTACALLGLLTQRPRFHRESR